MGDAVGAGPLYPVVGHGAVGRPRGGRGSAGRRCATGSTGPRITGGTHAGLEDRPGRGWPLPGMGGLGLRLQPTISTTQGAANHPSHKAVQCCLRPLQGDNRMKYEYDGETFDISEPKDCRMTVTGKGLTAVISIHEATSMYREDLNGWGTDCPTLQDALDGACRRILDMAGKPSKDELCKGMDEFFNKLSKT